MQGTVMGAAQVLTQGFHNYTNLQDRDSAYYFAADFSFLSCCVQYRLDTAVLACFASSSDT